jgi:hypothetical protein
MPVPLALVTRERLVSVVVPVAPVPKSILAAVTFLIVMLLIVAFAVPEPLMPIAALAPAPSSPLMVKPSMILPLLPSVMMLLPSALVSVAAPFGVWSTIEMLLLASWIVDGTVSARLMLPLPKPRTCSLVASASVSSPLLPAAVMTPPSLTSTMMSVETAAASAVVSVARLFWSLPLPSPVALAPTK